MTDSDERHLWIWYTPCGSGGVETYLLGMARESLKHGVKIWIAAITSCEGPLRVAFQELGVHLLDWSEFEPAFMSKCASTSIQERMRVDLTRIRPTLIALNDCNAFSIACAPILNRLRPFCTITDTFHIDSPLEEYLEFRKNFMEFLDGIASTNKRMITRFHAKFAGANRPQTRYIPNGVTLPNNPQQQRVAASTLRLLYVGRLVQDQKRIMDLPGLLVQLRDSGKDFMITIVGDGPCKEELAAEFGRLGLAQQTVLAGYLPPEQVRALYFEHDVLINLSTFEGFSMSVLEAFASGCVPVCTDVESLDKDVFLDDVNCRLCPVDKLELMVAIWTALTPRTLERLSWQALKTSRRLTSENTYIGYQTFLSDLRRLRPLEVWPVDLDSVLKIDWDMTRNNPWLAKRRPWHQWRSSIFNLLHRIRGASA